MKRNPNNCPFAKFAYKKWDLVLHIFSHKQQQQKYNPEIKFVRFCRIEIGYYERFIIHCYFQQTSIINIWYK